MDKVQHCDGCKCVRGFLPDGSPCPGLPAVDVERVFNAFQFEVGEWGEKTFPASSPESVLSHLTDEVIELCTDKSSEEAADVLLLLVHFAHKKGFSLLEAAQRKFEVNKSRKWGAPDDRGVVNHLPDLWEPEEPKPCA